MAKAGDSSGSDPRPRRARTAKSVAPADGPPTVGPVVGVGASAGGLEAIEAFLEAVPADSGLAIVVIQHLDPTNKSLLVELLARRAAIPVHQAANGMPVQANHAYVIPPGAYLAIANGRFVLTGGPAATVRLPVDYFLLSLARDRAWRGIGVILSGSGSDGTLGLKAIKEAGGLTLVQSPDDATFDGMPRSAIDAGAADHVLPVRDIPAAILRFAAQDYAKNGDSHETAEKDGEAESRAARIVDALHSVAGQDFSLYRTGTLLRRVDRRMALTGTANFEGYVARLRADAVEAESLAKDLLINVTSFFRDPDAFAFLSRQVLAPLVARQNSDQPIRVWVAGCATGEEAYSLGILLLELVGDADKQTRVQIFATDLDADAVAIARAGVYPESIEADLSPERLHRFFTRSGHTFTVGDALRKSIVFACHNLLSDPPLSRLDLISCRNLLIYLRPEAQKQVIATFHFALRDHGALFLGASESVGEAAGLFEPIDRAHRIYRQIRSPHRPWASLPARRRLDTATPPQGHRAAAGPVRRRLADLAQRALLDQFAPASVIVERNRDALYFFGPVDRFLALAAGEPGQDILSMARPGLRPRLRDAIERSVRTGKRAVARGAHVQRGGRTYPVEIEVSPVPETDGELLLISFIQIAAARTGKAAASEIEDAPGLQAELDATRRELNRTIRDLERTNEDLTAASEEAFSMNEELQATNEELETSKEELQSLNEELTTLNTELRQSLDSREATANDLANLLNGIGIATLFLDSSLRIKFFNPPASALFSVIQTDIGRPLADLTPKFNDPALLAETGAVLATGVARQKEVRDAQGIWYNRTILPYRTESGISDGVVITFADIAAAKSAQLVAARSRAFAEAIVETIHEPLVVLDQDQRVILANRAFAEAFNLEPDASTGHVPVGRTLPELGNPELMHPGPRAVVDELLRQDGGIDGREVEIERPGRPPRVLLLSGRRLPDLAADAERLLLVARDVTALRATTQQQFQSFMDSMPDPILTAAGDGRIRSVNTALNRLFEYEPGELIGQPIEVLVPADQRAGHAALHRSYLTNPVARPMGAGLDIQGVSKSGRVFSLEIALTPILGDGGAIISAAMRDISARRREEQAINDARLEALRANRAKSRFLQAATHDLRQPLQVVRLLQGALAARTTDPDAKSMLARLDQTVEVMNGVLAAFLDINQIENGTIKPSIATFSAADLLTRLRITFGPLAGAKGLTLRVVSSTAAIRGDPRLLERILGNLLSNAVQYTSKGKILIGCRRQAETLRIEVWDTGRGIDAEHVGAIFNEFYQVDPTAAPSNANAGIGLYIVDQLARLLGHKVAVRSVPGKGTVFSVEVPRAATGAAAATTAARREIAAGAALPPILIVEDDEAQRASMSLMLAAHGYRAAAVASGPEALALMADPSGFRPGIVLADHNLGGGENGLDAARRIAAQAGRTIPTVMVTGDVSDQTARAAAAEGFQLLHKPVRPAALLVALQAAAARIPALPVPSVAADPAETAVGSAEIAIVEDDADVRNATQAMLAARGYRAAGHASAEAFLADPRRRDYRCLLLDVGLPGMDGLALRRHLMAEGVSPPTIFITGGADVRQAIDAMRDGAADFLEKPIRPAALLESVARVLASAGARARGIGDGTGDGPVDSTNGMADSARAAGRARIAELTGRQREVMDRMIEGQSNKTIAAGLNIGQRTVEHHRSAVMAKMGVKSLAELVRLVLSLRL